MKHLLKLGILPVIAIMFMGAGNNTGFSPRVGYAYDMKSFTYANSQVDTLVINREAGVQAYGFSIHVKDSASITNAILFRTIRGKLQGVQAGDTVVSVMLCRQDSAITRSIVLAPLAEQYTIIVTFAGSANGVTTPTVEYLVQKQYSK